MKFLIAGESHSSFMPRMDTGVLLAAEVLRRGYSLAYLDQSRYPWKQNTDAYLSSLTTYQVKSVRPDTSLPFELGPCTGSLAKDYQVIFQRKDPPVDQAYLGHAQHFSSLPRQIIQVNNPDQTWRYSEHLLPQKFPEYAIDTVLCKTWRDFLHSVRGMFNEAVAKPKSFFGGQGIHFFANGVNELELKVYWDKWGPDIVVQPFINEISQVGDLRVLMMNGQIVGQVLRMPKKGSRLANLHQGATPLRAELTAIQRLASYEIAEELLPLGLYLLGIDFIGDKLSEINITCPSAVPQINQVMGIRAERLILDEIEKMAKILN